MNDIAGPVQGVTITGTGSYTPDRVLTNADLSEMVDTSDEWIRTRTGMVERRIARDDEPTSAMAVEAAKRALEAAECAPEELDLIIVATITPDMIMPSTACKLQTLLGVTNVPAFDLSAACSGFIYSMQVARQFILGGGAQKVLVVGCDKMSSITDWEDRGTCVLFGDAAGAVVMERSKGGRGVMSCVMGADGSLRDLLQIPAGGSMLPASAQSVAERLHYIKMGGNRVFKYAVRWMTTVGEQALEQAGVTLDDIKWVIPHQANIRIINAIGEKAKIPMSKFIINLDKYGNTTAATVPLALDEAVRDGRIQKGDLILTVVFGGGFTWGGAVIEWGA